MLNKVKLGNNGPMVSQMGFGCMGMSGSYEAERTDRESIQTIQAALASGINFFDTADIYGVGHSESLLGEALLESLKVKRKDIIIATKCGFVLTPDGVFYVDVSPKHITESCKHSLTRLGVSYIDLYYLHRMPAGGINAIRDSLDALINLLKDGMIRHIGLSEADANSIHFTHEYLTNNGFPDALAAIQSEFSIFVQDPLKNAVLETCRELGLSFIPYSPLCRGLLTEKMFAGFEFDSDDFRRELPMFQSNNFETNLAIRDRLLEFATTKGCTLPQLALAWLLAQDDYVIPIPGTKHIKNLMNNLQAINVKLTLNDLYAINTIVSPGSVKGSRYTSSMFALQNIQ